MEELDENDCEACRFVVKESTAEGVEGYYEEDADIEETLALNRFFKIVKAPSMS